MGKPVAGWNLTNENPAQRWQWEFGESVPDTAPFLVVNKGRAEIFPMGRSGFWSAVVWIGA